jgi:hypothetical protein
MEWQAAVKHPVHGRAVREYEKEVFRCCSHDRHGGKINIVGPCYHVQNLMWGDHRTGGDHRDEQRPLGVSLRLIDALRAVDDANQHELLRWRTRERRRSRQLHASVERPNLIGRR